MFKGDKLEVSLSQKGPAVLELSVNPTGSNVRSMLAQALLEFKDPLETHPQEAVEAPAQALDALYTKGVSLAYELFGGLTAYHQLVEWCEGWQQGLALSPEPLLIEVSGTRDNFFPLELLPLFEWRMPPVIDTFDAITRAAQAFLGFSAIIKRTLPVSSPQHVSLNARPRLPVRLFWYAGMGGARSEEAFLRDQEGIELRGPWPTNAVGSGDATDLLSRHLYDPATAPGSNNEACEDQVHHFACHCYTTNEATSRWYLELAAESGDPAEITMGNLLVALNKRWKEHHKRGPVRPLVFMNACGTSAMQPGSAISLPSVFMDNGSVGFIGTETRVPDVFASAFSAVFYDSLLRQRSVGRALHDAKWALLTSGHNPLGILYTFYGDPDLLVRLDESGGSDE